MIQQQQESSLQLRIQTNALKKQSKQLASRCEAGSLNIPISTVSAQNTLSRFTKRRNCALGGYNNPNIQYLTFLQATIFKYTFFLLLQLMQKDQQDWQSIVPETEGQKEATDEIYPPRGVKLPDTQIKIIQAQKTSLHPPAKMTVKSMKNNRLNSNSSYVPFNQSYKFSQQHSFMKVSDINQYTQRYSIMVKVIKQYFYYNSQDIPCTQVTLSDSSGSAWGFFIDTNCNYFIPGSILCIINGVVRIYNNRISLQLHKYSKDSYIYKCEFKNLETNTKYNISHRIIGERVQYRQWPATPRQGRNNYRVNYNRPYYQYPQHSDKKNTYSRSSSRKSNRSSCHKNIRRQNQQNNQCRNLNNSRNQSNRKKSFRQDSRDRFQNQKRSYNNYECTYHGQRSRKKQYIQKSRQKRRERNDIQKPRSYHSYLLNKSSHMSLSKTMNDDAKNDSIQVKFGNSSTITSVLPTTSSDSQPMTEIVAPQKLHQERERSQVQIEVSNEELE